MVILFSRRKEEVEREPWRPRVASSSMIFQQMDLLVQVGEIEAERTRLN